MWNTSRNDCQLYLDPSKFQKPYGNKTEKDMEQLIMRYTIISVKHKPYNCKTIQFIAQS